MVCGDVDCEYAKPQQYVCMHTRNVQRINRKMDHMIIHVSFHSKCIEIRQSANAFLALYKQYEHLRKHPQRIRTTSVLANVHECREEEYE